MTENAGLTAPRLLPPVTELAVMVSQIHPDVEATAEEIASMEIRGAATIAEAAARALRVQDRKSVV